VAKPIIHRLEAIQIETEQRGRTGSLLSATKCKSELVAKSYTVEEPCQGVMIRKVKGARFGLGTSSAFLA
jgi:hypothetical protein